MLMLCASRCAESNMVDVVLLKTGSSEELESLSDRCWRGRGRRL